MGSIKGAPLETWPSRPNKHTGLYNIRLEYVDGDQVRLALIDATEPGYVPMMHYPGGLPIANDDFQRMAYYVFEPGDTMPVCDFRVEGIGGRKTGSARTPNTNWLIGLYINDNNHGQNALYAGNAALGKSAPGPAGWEEWYSPALWDVCLTVDAGGASYINVLPFVNVGTEFLFKGIDPANELLIFDELKANATFYVPLATMLTTHKGHFPYIIDFVRLRVGLDNNHATPAQLDVPVWNDVHGGQMPQTSKWCDNSLTDCSRYWYGTYDIPTEFPQTGHLDQVVKMHVQGGDAATTRVKVWALGFSMARYTWFAGLERPW